MLTLGEELLNKLLFLFSLCTKSILEVEQLMSHRRFYLCPYYVSGSVNISVVLRSMQGQRTLRFHQKYLLELPPNS